MIKRIHVENFRSLADVTVDLDPLTVLIGRSGTGKSNLVNALRFVRDCLTVGSHIPQAVNYLQAQIHAAARKNDRVRFQFVLDIPGVKGELDYLLSFKMGQGVDEEKLSLSGTSLFHQKDGKFVTRPKANSTVHPGLPLLGSIPALRESLITYIALCKGVGCYEFPITVLQPSVNHGMVNLAFGMQVPPQDSFDDRGANYLPVIERIVSDINKLPQWDRIVKTLRAINPAVVALTTSVPSVESVAVGYQIADVIRPFNLAEESEGLRRFLAHLIALYQSPSKQTLVFEHPESGLHPGALSALAEEMKACPGENRGQVILTTHSPQLLDYFPVEAIRVVEIKEQVTTIARLSREQLDAVHQQLLFNSELLTVDPARPADGSSAEPEGVKG